MIGLYLSVAATILPVAVLSVATIAAHTTGAQAQSLQDFYRGKTVTVGIGSGPGGGYDAYGRLLVRHYGRFLPGAPSVILQHIPAAGGMVAANNTYSVVAKDGTYITMIPSSVLLDGVLGSESAKFDAERFMPIGNMNEEADTCSVWHTTGFNSAKDFFVKEAIIGTAGPASNSHTFPLVMNAVLGTKFKLIAGYGGGSALRINAMEKGELHGACDIFVSTVLSQFGQQVQNGNLKVLLQMGIGRHPAFPDAPNAIEFAKSDEDKQMLNLFFGQLALGRALFGPPEIPADRARALSEAFAATMQDAEFQAEAKKLSLETRWFGPDRMREIVRQMAATPAAIRTKAREFSATK